MLSIKRGRKDQPFPHSIYLGGKTIRTVDGSRQSQSFGRVRGVSGNWQWRRGVMHAPKSGRTSLPRSCAFQGTAVHRATPASHQVVVVVKQHKSRYNPSCLEPIQVPNTINMLPSDTTVPTISSPSTTRHVDIRQNLCTTPILGERSPLPPPRGILPITTHSHYTQSPPRPSTKQPGYNSPARSSSHPPSPPPPTHPLGPP